MYIIYFTEQMIMEINTKIKTQDFILLILNCVKYRAKAQKQKETWLQHLPNNLLYFHVLGNPELESDYMIDEKEHILYVKTADDYNSLPKKVINAYKTINQIYNYKYIFKTDDDQMVGNTRFFSILMNILESKYYLPLNKRPHYGGNKITVKQDHISQYYRIHPELPNDLIVKSTTYCNGRFYFLSDDVVQILLKKEESICSEYFEDYAIGYNIPDYFKTTIMALDTDKYFKDFV
jgi:hypothetical protein